MSSIGEQVKVVEASSGRGRQEAITALLRLIRTQQVRMPEVVVKYGTLLKSPPPEVLEQVFIAALDVHDLTLAKAYEGALSRQFPSGARMARLKAMALEANEEWSQASEAYSKLVDDNGSNSLAHKRLICVTLGKSASDLETATALGEYLSKFQSDRAAWQRLAELHAKNHDVPRAIFCYEELTLFDPAAPQWHCRLGELYCGTNDLFARKHFAQSLELSKSSSSSVRGTTTAGTTMTSGKKRIIGNARAATGLLLACYALGQQDPEDPLNVALGTLASQHLKALYQTSADPDLASTIVAPFVKDKSPPYTRT